MDLGEIKKAIGEAKSKRHGEIIFGMDVDDGAGLVYVTVYLENSVVEFTTDVPIYKWGGDLERALEDLFGEFGIDKYGITFHHHIGETHDKDVQVFAGKQVPEVVEYILENFYEGDEEFSYFSR